MFVYQEGIEQWTWAMNLADKQKMIERQIDRIERWAEQRKILVDLTVHEPALAEHVIAGLEDLIMHDHA